MTGKVAKIQLTNLECHAIKLTLFTKSGKLKMRSLASILLNKEHVNIDIKEVVC